MSEYFSLVHLVWLIAAVLLTISILWLFSLYVMPLVRRLGEDLIEQLLHVGAMGMILQTVDGGQTWSAMRGKDRRTATMAIHSRASRVSFHLMAKLSGEEGRIE